MSYQEIFNVKYREHGGRGRGKEKAWRGKGEGEKKHVEGNM